MNTEKRTFENVSSPSQFMRQIRPEQYSDSTTRTTHRLKPEVLSHHLDTLTERNQTHDFELFCRKLCERAVCPSLRPATGPEGGGDSKADTETSPVAEEIGKLTYVGLANGGGERWAFAFSAKKTWAEKARSDVDGIIATGRGYTQIIFVTSRAARAKDRARVEDELTQKYGVRVTIHDRAWILTEVVEKNRLDLAYNYLGVGDEASDRDLGPADYSRKRQLEDVERELADPSAFDGMEMQRATEALVAAKLARELELTRVEVDGRFIRAIRLADDGGTHRQQLTARYEALWTAFWWFDDIKTVVAGYDDFEERVLDDTFAKNLEMLCDLAQLLFNAVTHEYLTTEQAGLEARIARLKTRLAELANDLERPNNALEAKTSLLTIRVNEAMLAEQPDQLSSLWPQFADVVAQAEGLGEYDAGRLTRLIEVFGQVAGKDRGYGDLVDQLSAFVGRRTGQGQGALILLKRAQQLDFDENMEMIRLLGKAAPMLAKKEYTEDRITALALLAMAYRSAGLLWAARAACTSAVAAIFIEADERGGLPPSILPMMMTFAWVAVELKHFPEVLDAIQLARGCLSSLPFEEESKQKAADRLKEFDMVLGCQIANVAWEELPRLERIPDVLSGLDLYTSRAVLMYRLGYEATLREEGWIPEKEPKQEVESFFNRFAGQPAGDSRWRPAIFNDDQAQVFLGSVLGVRIHVKHEATDVSITVAEAIAGTMEAFLATAFEINAFAHAERFDVTVVEADVDEFTVLADADRMTLSVQWPAGLFPGAPAASNEFIRMLLEVAATIFSATCHVKNVQDVSRLATSDAAMDRVAMIGSVSVSRQRIFGGVARLSVWDKHSPKRYEAKPDRPTVHPVSPSKEAAGLCRERGLEDAKGSWLSDHRQVKVRSVIDVHLWDRAMWSGAAYGRLHPAAPPFLGLMFEDRDAAIAIFQRWRDRFGAVDENEEIYIGILRRFSAEYPTHYGMVITSNVPVDRTDSPVAVMMARSLIMQPPSDVNLDRFLSSFESEGSYLLIPLVLAPGQPPEPITDLSLVKRRLSVKVPSQVGEHDVEAGFVASHGMKKEPIR